MDNPTVSPDQISGETPIGILLNTYIASANEEDIALAKDVYAALNKTIEGLKNVPQFTSKHLAIAALNVARVAVAVHEECRQLSRMN